MKPLQGLEELVLGSNLVTGVIPRSSPQDWPSASIRAEGDQENGTGISPRTHHWRTASSTTASQPHNWALRICCRKASLLRLCLPGALAKGRKMCSSPFHWWKVNGNQNSSCKEISSFWFSTFPSLWRKKLEWMLSADHQISSCSKHSWGRQEPSKDFGKFEKRTKGKQTKEV